MNINTNCISLIKEFEGFMSAPYHGAADVPGLYTIGYGTIIYPNGQKVQATDPAISEQTALDYLAFDIGKVSSQVKKYVKQNLSDNQFGALVSFTYNLGIGNLLASTLLKKVNTNPIDVSIRDEFVKWIYSNGQKQSGLLRRRIAEADLYFTV